MSDPVCRFCDRPVVLRAKESHAGELCGSCWEVKHRVLALVEKPLFREFIKRAMAGVKA